MDSTIEDTCKHATSPAQKDMCNLYTTAEGQASTEEVAVSSGNPPYCSSRIKCMTESRKKFPNQTEFEIASSKIHWTQTVDSTYGSTEEVKAINQKIFEDLRNHPQWGRFFISTGEFARGKKFAEGGQAEIYTAIRPNRSGSLGEEPDIAVLKVMKGYTLQDLQLEWPLGILTKTLEPLYGGTLLEDGSFAFVIHRCWGDLRKLVDLRMLHKENQGPPFQLEDAKFFMKMIAFWMYTMHERDIVHRDVKAANVLIYQKGEFDPIALSFSHDNIGLYVTDFECSNGVLGTRFWRAPEVLLAKRCGSDNCPDTFSEKTDVYSYGMTCYEILVGKIPFEDEPANNYDIVISGKRPDLPDDLPYEFRALIAKCWHQDPSQRPIFKDIYFFWCMHPYVQDVSEVGQRLRMLAK